MNEKIALKITRLQEINAMAITIFHVKFRGEITLPNITVFTG